MPRADVHDGRPAGPRQGGPQGRLPAAHRTGELRLQAFSVTEADAGSDTTSIATTAVRDGEDYVITGHKNWTGRILESDPALVLARTAVLWGIPYLISGQALSSSAASALITLLVGCTIVIGPVMGILTRRHPLRRSWLVLAVIAANAGTWAVVLAWPPPAPLWLLVLLVVVLASSGPGSVVGLDIARTSNPTTALGVAQSMVNSGGFLASLVVLQAMGFALSAAGD